MGVQNTARFEAMVTDFCVTVAELGGRRVERGVVADTLAERVAATAATVGVSPAWAFRRYIPDDWGRQMALRSWKTLAAYQSVGDDVGAVGLPIGLLARLTAGLGQAQSYAAANPAPLAPAAGPFGGAADQLVEFDSGRAGDAVTGLGLALQHAGHPHRPAPGAAGIGAAGGGPEALPGVVVVGGDVLTWTYQVLTGFAHAVAAGRWSHCPCGDEHGQADLDSGVLDRVRTDLAELARLAPAAAAAATTQAAGATNRDQHSTV